MKGVIKKILANAGFKIERLDNPNPLTQKLERLIAEHYGCYKDTLFPELPPLDVRTLELIKRLDGTQISEAIYLLHALAQTRLVQGDVCEFGVAQGYTSSLIAHTILNSSKKLWLFDSFEGLPAPTEKDKLKDDIYGLQSMEAYQGTMKHSVDVLIHNLNGVAFPRERTFIVDGFIEETIKHKQMPAKVSFAYVDFDFYQPIKTALYFLHERTETGAVIIVDDYDFFSEGAKIAVDEFVNEFPGAYSFELPIQSAGKFALLKRR